MAAGFWSRVVAAGAAVVSLAGCGKADLAVLRAPGCPEGASARPERQQERPSGTVWAWAPLFQAPEGTPREGAVPGLSDVVSIADSGYSMVAVRGDGTVWSYGTNVAGSLGHGSRERHYLAEPRRVTGIGPAHAVYGSGETFYVVLRDGTVRAWGSDRFLVRGGKREGHDGVTTPERVPGAKGVAAMGPGPLNAFALRGDGRVLGWGINLTDVLGDRDSTRLTTIDGVKGVVDVASAGGAVVAATADGRVCAWGGNAHGLLGVEPRGGQSGRPVLVRGLRDVVQVAGGSDVAYALDRDGTVRAWGRGASGALGDGDRSDHTSARPVRVNGLPEIRRIAAHGFTGYAIDTSGGLWAWGSGLPLGEHAPRTARPVRVPLPGPALDVSGHHAIVGTG
ncbi:MULTISPECIES: RCC1 repeat domain-containing protein [unclassified Streptomyces]|uniref:RCC1 domain-containing protein n=1 Tax=unclassified Streptomyces TaxID=2593676 RepID=UPI00093B3C4A|nr:RCC1 repeat domain-containing protein [Streptomyces sp. CB02400]OKJ99280.1 RCC1 repeat domain-containing protein [Streptomyces sp. CB02400]